MSKIPPVPGDLDIRTAEARIGALMEDWDGIMSREGPAVWRTVYRLLGNSADADECFQETFLGALRLSQRQPLRDVRAVLQRLATARSMDVLRRRYRQRKREETTDWATRPADGATPGQCAEAAELSERLRTALAELPTKQAEAFCLFSLEGWTYQQIAGHLDSSVDAVGVLLFRASNKVAPKVVPGGERGIVLEYVWATEENEPTMVRVTLPV